MLSIGSIKGEVNQAKRGKDVCRSADDAAIGCAMESVSDDTRCMSDGALIELAADLTVAYARRVLPALGHAIRRDQTFLSAVSVWKPATDW